MRTPFSCSLINSTKQLLTIKALKVNMSTSSVLECIALLYLLEQTTSISVQYLDEMIDDFLAPTDSSISQAFRQLHHQLSDTAKKNVLLFLYKCIASGEIVINSITQANFSRKDGTFLFYYALISLRGTPLHQHTSKHCICYDIGPTITDENYNEYIYISKNPQFTHKTKTSNVFQDICIAFNVPNYSQCNCLRIHHSHLSELNNLLNQI